MYLLCKIMQSAMASNSQALKIQYANTWKCIAFRTTELPTKFQSSQKPLLIDTLDKFQSLLN